GATLMTADTPDAKLTPAAVARLATKFEGVHHVKPTVLSLTQATELGTVYTLGEMRTLAALAREHGLKVHLDGARFANAVARFGCTPAEASWRAGVDVMTFGGVKNGLGIGEAIVVFDLALAAELDRRIKQAGQLNSKMRLAAAAWLGLLEGDVWLANARHANAMAQRLAGHLAGLPGIRLMHAVEANGVFAEIPEQVQAGLRGKGWAFYTFVPPLGCRLMCAWDTTPETVDRLAADLAELTCASPA
ncbi:MAG: beta-eliminating lyase-related protein, partial [Hyphomicrobiaceae bacterium]